MKNSTIRALENLNLTKEEAQEWIEMLSEKEHFDWKEIVQKHTFYPTKIKTNRLVCYKNDDGSFEYHYYIDGQKANQIYAIQIGPTPKTLSPNIPYYLMRIRDEAKNVTITEAMSFETSGWKLILTEEICFLYNKLDKDDADVLKALSDCGVSYEALDVFKTWYADTKPGKEFKFNVRLFKSISEIEISE